MIWALWSALAAAACPENTSSGALELAAEEAETAFHAMDVAAFDAADAKVEAMVPCLREPLPRPVVARLHRLTGLTAFVRRDLALAPLAFAAARSVEPDYLLPTSLVPPNHPIQALYTQEPLDSRVSAPVPPPLDGYALIDGRRATERADGWPALVQLVDSGGQVWLSALVLPGQPMPSYPVAKDPPPVEPVATPLPMAPTPVDPTPRRPAALGVALVATSAATAAVAGGAEFLSWRSRREYYATTHAEDLDRLRQRTNNLEYVAMGAGVVAVGAGVGAFVTLRW